MTATSRARIVRTDGHANFSRVCFGRNAFLGTAPTVVQRASQRDRLVLFFQSLSRIKDDSYSRFDPGAVSLGCAGKRRVLRRLPGGRICSVVLVSCSLEAIPLDLVCRRYLVRANPRATL